MRKEMPLLETLIYYVLNVMTFGALWFAKIVIKKALIEANQNA